jgi:hypothetical protein
MSAIGWIAVAVGVVSLLAALFLLLWWPRHQKAQWRSDNVAGKDLFDVENDSRDSVLQAVTRLAALAAFLFTIWQFSETQRATNESLRLTEKGQNQAQRATSESLRVAEQGQITERFSRAIDQLGAKTDGRPNMELRLGGIYSLERIAFESERDHWPIMEVLSAYVRKNARRKDDQFVDCGTSRPPDPRHPAEVPPDVEAVVIAIRRRNHLGDETETQTFDLSHTDLHFADLTGATLKRVRLSGAELTGADFREATLPRAEFNDARLIDADFSTRHETGPDSYDYSSRPVQLTVAEFNSVDARGASFHGADLRQAFFTYARLDEVDFAEADLHGAFMRGACLAGADFDGANLKGASLAGARGATPGQFDNAITDKSTQLPLSR